MKIKLLSGYIMAALLAGCTSSPQQPVVQKDQGRPETKKLEAATAVGYDGAAIRRGVDNTLNKTENRTNEIDKREAETK